MTPSSPTDESESQTLSKLHLHIVPDDKPVFACHKCSEVVVSATDSLYEVCSGI
jgi:hypothetical protein